MRALELPINRKLACVMQDLVRLREVPAQSEFKHELDHSSPSHSTPRRNARKKREKKLCKGVPLQFRFGQLGQTNLV